MCCVLPLDILPLPSVVVLGFYNNLQGIAVQVIYIALIVLLLKY